jgi:hypothetical protein
MRLGEALALQHRDWHTGLGDTPFIEVVPREDHPHGLRVKNGGFRRIYVSDELDRLYGEYLWRLCDAGPDVTVGDLDSWWLEAERDRRRRGAERGSRAGRPTTDASPVACLGVRLRRDFKHE